jgi:hypothetical protein
MRDDDGKLESQLAVRRQIIASEVERLRAYAQLMIETTPYGEKACLFTPSFLHIQTECDLTACFVRAARRAGFVLEWNARLGRCVLHILCARPLTVNDGGNIQCNESTKTDGQAKERHARVQRPSKECVN